jgi:transcriptional regulator with XRE-family HTH domain
MDITVSIVVSTMALKLIDDTDVQQAFSAHLRRLREQAKFSRETLAQRSGVPAPTIKKFELTGQISFRQLLLLWQCLDDLHRLYDLTLETKRKPMSIDEVLSDEL